MPWATHRARPAGPPDSACFWERDGKKAETEAKLLPAVLTALRVSVGTAVAVLFIAEQSLTNYGLGYYIVIETYQVLMYPEMYTGILGMGLLGVLLYFLIYSIELKISKHLYVG